MLPARAAPAVERPATDTFIELYREGVTDMDDLLQFMASDASSPDARLSAVLTMCNQALVTKAEAKNPLTGVVVKSKLPQRPGASEGL